MCLALLTSCAPSARDMEADPERGVRQAFSAWGADVVVELDRTEATLAERLHLNLDVAAGEDTEIRFPETGDELGPFAVVQVRTGHPELDAANRTRIRRTYVLEGRLPGEQTIPPLRVGVRDREDAAAQAREIVTEALRVRIRSLLPGGPDVPDIRDIQPPVELPRERRPRAVWAGGVLALALGVLAAARLRRRRSRTAPAAVRIPPHERAYEALERLVAEDLIGRGEIKIFYRRISGILRSYIEDRFGLRAAEQTTPEFLDALRHNERLDRKYRALLSEFLRYSDLVKFAEEQPGADDIQNTFDGCRRFIAETAEPPAEGL